jgi:hypothetical protein
MSLTFNVTRLIFGPAPFSGDLEDCLNVSAKRLLRSRRILHFSDLIGDCDVPPNSGSDIGRKTPSGSSSFENWIRVDECNRDVTSVGFRNGVALNPGHGTNLEDSCRPKGS